MLTFYAQTVSLALLALTPTTLPAAATAFVQSRITSNLRGIDHNHVHRGVTSSSIQASADLPHGTLDIESEMSQQMKNAMLEKQQELLSDMSKLQDMHPQSTVAADNEMREGTLTTEQMVLEVLFSSRLHLPFLNKSALGPSKLDGAGRGLFAAQDIAEGEIITCYPGDALLCGMPSLDDKDDSEEVEDEYDDEEDDYVDEVVLWGTHVPENDRWDEDTVFDGNETTQPLTAYAVSVNETYSVMGHPALDDNPAYFGHFANDGGGHLAFEKPNSQSNIQTALELGLDRDTEEEIGVEKNIAAYVLKSLEVANAMHKTFDGTQLHMMTVATQDIKEGEEILVTYGPEYWVGHS